MPQTPVFVFRAPNGEIPLEKWLDGLERSEPRAYAKCLMLIQRLEAFGYELGEPLSKPLRNGINELRGQIGTVNYRILYFFHNRVAVLSHGFTKEGKVPDAEIDRAVGRMKLVKANTSLHTAEWEVT